MRILFDQGTPLPLRKSLTGHEIAAGWSELGNGELIAAAETSGYDVLITTDQNFEVSAEPIWAATRHHRPSLDALA